MGRGRGGGHKGGKRVFTNPQDIEVQRQREEKERAWRAKRGEAESSEDEEAEDEEDSEASASGSDQEDETEGAKGRTKGVQHLIEVSNPNRVEKKVNVKKLDVDAEGATPEVQLSRREREELEKQKARLNYAKMQAEGKTDQARADLARLAIIRQQREEAQRRKTDEMKAKDEAKQKAVVDRTKATKSVSADVTVKSKRK